MVLAAVAQICSRNNPAINLLVCKSVIKRAAGRGAEFLCLPEAADYIAPSDQVLSLAEPLSSSSFLAGIRDAAREHSIWVSVGIHELPESAARSKASSNAEDGTRCYNTQCLINPKGEIASVYRKLHLFDVDSEQMKVKESGTTLRGDKLPDITPTAIGKVGMLTCYDLRFAEPALLNRERGAEIITYPSAFATRTGMAHWEPLLRARAIETQTYVLAAAQVGSHPPTSRSSYGAACIVDPWGSILAQCNDNISSYENSEQDAGSGSFCIAEIDLDYLHKIRKEMPLWEQRRPEVYKQHQG